MLIYCSHKYGGNEENKAKAERKILELQKADTENTYISPIHAFGFSYNEFDYDTGMKMCLELLDKCDRLIVLSEESEGVLREISRANKNETPIIWLKESVFDNFIRERFKGE